MAKQDFQNVSIPYPASRLATHDLLHRRDFHSRRKAILDDISTNGSIYPLKYEYTNFYLFPLLVAQKVLEDSGLDRITILSGDFSKQEHDFAEKMTKVKNKQAAAFITRGDIPQAVMIERDIANELADKWERKTGQALSSHMDWDAIISAAVRNNCRVEVTIHQGKVTAVIVPPDPHESNELVTH